MAAWACKSGWEVSCPPGPRVQGQGAGVLVLPLGDQAAAQPGDVGSFGVAGVAGRAVRRAARRVVAIRSQAAVVVLLGDDGIGTVVHPDGRGDVSAEVVGRQEPAVAAEFHQVSLPPVVAFVGAEQDASVGSDHRRGGPVLDDPPRSRPVMGRVHAGRRALATGRPPAPRPRRRLPAGPPTASTPAIVSSSLGLAPGRGSLPGAG